MKRLVGLGKSRNFALAIGKQQRFTKNNNGALDERLSQRSAKPCTPVRIGYAPQIERGCSALC